METLKLTQEQIDLINESLNFSIEKLHDLSDSFKQVKNVIELQKQTYHINISDNFEPRFGLGDDK